MCCFSVASLPARWFQRLLTPKVHVSKTNIVARMVSPGVQALAYGMNLATRREVAMVLPLPVVPGSGEDALTFIDLSKHPRMFDELAALFEMPPAKGGLPLRSLQARLTVHEIGSFVASYVPTRADFARLDPRFRLPEVLFEAVPHYADYGFAVFQLAPGKVTVHPMAMTFPTRAPDRLFFPTVHVHDGTFHPTAKFDHALYYQAPRTSDAAVSWNLPGTSYEGLLVEGEAVLRRTLHARLPNQDTWIAAAT